MFATRWIDRIDAGDRSLLERWVIDVDSSVQTIAAWKVITHAGGAIATIGAVLVALLLPGWPREAGIGAGLALASSHLAVQVVKRFVNRPRPEGTPAIRCPDRFSFPSGHATAALAVTASFALVVPAGGVLLVAFGILVGWSRVVLGVHYPGDVVIGQLLALAAVAAVHALM
jgi:undecaprenyl-diphosphatase